jgi:dynein heavy chain
VSDEAIEKLEKHYNHFMYQALLNSTKASLNAIKKRVGSRGGTGFLYVERPFFELEVCLAVPAVKLNPELDDIQKTINKTALAVLKCSKTVFDWRQDEVDDAEKFTFFDRIAKDIEIVRVCLLLTGAIQGTKSAVQEYLNGFKKYDWLWREKKEVRYQKFMNKKTFSRHVPE